MAKTQYNLKKVATVAAVVAITAACVATAGVAGVVGGVAVGSATAASIATVAAGVAIASTVATAAALAVENRQSVSYYSARNQSVYVMRDSTGQVRYVGRTNNPTRRQAEHAKDLTKQDLLPLEVKFTGLTKTEARIVEQILISTYSLNNLRNARREIAAGKVGGFANYMGQTIELFANLQQDELLNFIEGN